MKAPITWVLLANAGTANIVENRGTGKGFAAVGGKSWSAEPPVEYADRAGAARVGDSYEKANPRVHAEEIFAQEVAQNVSAAFSAGRFDRLILCAAPHMLGNLRPHLSPELRGVTLAEVAKDLTRVPVDRLVDHLGEFIAA